MAYRFGVVVLAAGKSSRFGGNKLLAEFGGKTVMEHAVSLAASCGAARAAVVASDPDVIRILEAQGMEVIVNGNPLLGQAHSIVLGVSSMEALDAVLLLAADQPLLTRESLKRLIDGFTLSGKGMACLQDKTHFGNPAIFSNSYFGMLKRLTGDCGAKRILAMNADDLLIVDCIGDDELSDADTREQLEYLKTRVQ